MLDKSAVFLEARYFNDEQFTQDCFTVNGVVEKDQEEITKETFKVFKFDDGIDALWIIDNDNTDELRNLKGKLVTVTISDEEQTTFNTRKEPATFKGKIAMIKREQNLSEETLSNMLGCGKSTIHDWLNGSVPSRKFRKKIEDLYKFYYEEQLGAKNE